MKLNFQTAKKKLSKKSHDAKKTFHFFHKNSNSTRTNKEISSHNLSIKNCK